ncbi:MAG: sulfite exporter TauE/SafE family protein [Nanoarchaeota archaeon]|nr:sulfite exporter TauE/SafE family protein [Nanoarchaeota archaeon]
MIVTKKFKAKGMQCHSCEQIIHRTAKKVGGVEDLKVNYETGLGEVTFDSDKTDIHNIFKEIEDKGYDCAIAREKDAEIIELNSNKIFGWLFGILGVVLVGYFILKMSDKIQLPELSQNMGYGLLFLVGLITGFHCIAMCGGFVVSYTAKGAKENVKPHWLHLAYGLGKLISYTTIGALFGLLGSFIAFTPTMRGFVGILAGIFLVIYGLSMMNVFSFLRKLRIKSPMFMNKFLGKQSAHSGPFVVGLLNGLMIACGPLQAMYIMAAGTGSAIEGAKLLFIFALGTLPVMIGFGYIASYVSGKLKSKLVMISGILIIVLGLFMLNNGLTLTGSGYDFKSVVGGISGIGPAAQASGSNSGQIPSGNIAILKDGYQEIYMDVTRSGWSPNAFVIQKGIPVRWIIDGKEITSCNNAIQVPAYGLEFKIKQGQQTIEFTPDKTGTTRWSCWMGMIPGTFIVKDSINPEDTSLKVEAAQVAAATPKGASCGAGCGCGMGR